MRRSDKHNQSLRSRRSSRGSRSRSQTSFRKQKGYDYDDGDGEKTTGANGQPRKKQIRVMVVGSKKFKINVSLLREIKRLQTSTALLITKASFMRLVKELLLERAEDLRCQEIALQALQEAAESYLVQFFEDSYACTMHAKRCTLIPRDMQLIQFLRK